MDKDSKIYRDLQKHLDRLPSGFPAMESGVEIRILKHLFTPEEANMAAQLSMKPEPLKRIYKRIKKGGISIEELQQLLDRMVYKGTVLVREEGYDEKRYSNAGLSAGGMFDFQVNRLTKDLINDFTQYLHERFDTPRPPGKKPPPKRILPLRTIPIEKSIPLPEKYRISIYDDVRKLVENARGQIAVANCVCRQTKDLLGQSCRHTHLRETCLMIGSDQAKHYIGMGIGRPITKEEALDILKKVQESGLILQPENSQRPEAICCCCGDCCELLAMTKRFPRPADIYVTNYFLEVDPRLCKGCKKCIERCQLEARVMVNGVSTVNLDRCIGCGNCVVVCESNASRLHKKERELVLSKDKEAW
jgi:ferredoxin